MSNESKRKLVAHLMRRAGFGATSAELDELCNLDYDALVDSLIDPKDTSWMGEQAGFEPLTIYGGQWFELVGSWKLCSK